MPTPEMHPLGQLLGGVCTGDSDLVKVVRHLCETLNGLVIQATQLDFGNRSNPQASILGPYLARGILETGFTLMLARLDLFRVLVLRRIQQSASYELDVRSNCALQWRGDFLADEKIDDPWKPSRKPKDMTRALLGDYHDSVFWRPSLINLLDGAENGRGGKWMSDLRLVAPDNLIKRMRSRSERTYTACSKGVHHEFVIPLSAYYASEQMVSLLMEVVEICAVLGLVLNSGSHVPFCLSGDQALSCLEAIQQGVQEING